MKKILLLSFLFVTISAAAQYKIPPKTKDLRKTFDPYRYGVKASIITHPSLFAVGGELYPFVRRYGFVTTGLMFGINEFSESSEEAEGGIQKAIYTGTFDVGVLAGWYPVFLEYNIMSTKYMFGVNNFSMDEWKGIRVYLGDEVYIGLGFYHNIRRDFDPEDSNINVFDWNIGIRIGGGLE